MRTPKLYLCMMSALLCSSLAIAQKTFFIRLEGDSTKLFINQWEWDGEAFFTMENNEPIYQALVVAPSHMRFHDVLHDKTNYTYAAQQQFYVDSSSIAKVKIVELNYDLEQEFSINTMDYATYQKDLMHDGQLSDKIYQSGKQAIFQEITPSFINLNQLTHDYHGETIGRYDFYAGGKVNNLKVYKINLSDTEWFLQVFVEMTWKFKVGENYVGSYQHPGTSGRFAYNNQLHESKNLLSKEITTVQDVSYKNALKLAIHDAMLSSYLYFLDDAQERLK